MPAYTGFYSARSAYWILYLSKVILRTSNLLVNFDLLFFCRESASSQINLHESGVIEGHGKKKRYGIIYCLYTIHI